MVSSDPTPKKCIFESSDLQYFKHSIAYERLHNVINLIIQKAKGVALPKGVFDLSLVTRENVTSTSSDPLNDDITSSFSPATLSVLNVLHQFNKLIDATPPLEGPRRFGNMARRDWQTKVEANAGSLLEDLTKDADLRAELLYYLVNSFGSPIRLDYGSGHELSFIAFIGGLIEFKLLDITKIDAVELLCIFAKYYDLSRRLILTYSLEPAGSHGVWGLDDHFHFIYILGASQFNLEGDSRQLVPPVSQILSSLTIEDYKGTNFYVNAIAFIFKIKLGPFHEHSPIIYDIHKTVSLWSKVLSGLLKMYEVEVFGKFPVVQHFWFGSKLFPWIDSESRQKLPVRDVPKEQEQEEEDTLPGFINGFSGTKTTKTNITLTGAPWARQNTTHTPGVLPQRGVPRPTGDRRK